MAFEYRADCFTYDEEGGNWTRHRPTRNRTYIVEATDPGIDPVTGKPHNGSKTEYYKRYFDRRRSLGRKMSNVNVCRPITGWHREVLFHENVAFAASTSLANGKWIVAGGITGNNSFYGGEKCVFREGT